MANTTIATGSFFYSSWGYEQTNVNFYIVTKTTAATITLAKVEANRVSRGSNHGIATPTNKIIGKEFSRKLNQIVKVDSSSYAYLWDGRPQCYNSNY